LLAALLFAASAHAEDTASVEEVVVTATRLPSSITNAPDVEVITDKDIRRHQATFAFDVLALLPSVEITRSGAFGGVTSIQLRGASSDQTLVLVDGAPMNDPTAPAGGFDFSSLDLADVKQIEVLPGPQGALWGSDAIGGVVSITTREPDGWSGSAEGGSFGTLRAAASAGVSRTRQALGASVAWYDTGGISKADAIYGNTERDPFHSFTAQANGRASLTDAVSLEARVRYNKAFAALDSFGGPVGVIDGPDTQHERTVSGFVRADIKGFLGFDHELRVDGMDMDRLNDSFFGGFDFPFEAKGRRLDYRWTATRSDRRLGDLLLGAELLDAREDTGSGVQTSRNWAGFAIWRFQPLHGLTTTLSLRRDEPRDYQGVTTARGAAVYELGSGFSLSGSVGQGFKAPSIFQTTYPCFECLPPGPAKGLRPERALGWDVTLAWRSPDGRTTLKATAYRLAVHDQIDYIYPQGYVNLSRTRTIGLEADAETELGHGFSLQARYAHADGRNLETDTPLLRLPSDSGSASLAWQGQKASAAVTLRAQSSAADVYGTIRPFAVVDVTGAYALTRRISLTARIQNLADVHYQEAFGYGEPGFGLFAGIRLTE
jgi:vitamin B12 transporter